LIREWSRALERRSLRGHWWSVIRINSVNFQIIFGNARSVTETFCELRPTLCDQVEPRRHRRERKELCKLRVASEVPTGPHVNNAAKLRTVAWISETISYGNCVRPRGKHTSITVGLSVITTGTGSNTAGANPGDLIRTR